MDVTTQNATTYLYGNKFLTQIVNGQFGVGCANYMASCIVWYQYEFHAIIISEVMAN